MSAQADTFNPEPLMRLGDHYSDAQRAMLVELGIPAWLVAPSPVMVVTPSQDAPRTVTDEATQTPTQPQASPVKPRLPARAPPQAAMADAAPTPLRDASPSVSTPFSRSGASLPTHKALPAQAIWPRMHKSDTNAKQAAMGAFTLPADAQGWLFLTHAPSLADLAAGHLLSDPSERELITQIAQSVDFARRALRCQRMLKEPTSAYNTKTSTHADADGALLSPSVDAAPSPDVGLDSPSVSAHYAAASDATSLVDLMTQLQPTVIVVMGTTAQRIAHSVPSNAAVPHPALIVTYTLSQLMRNGLLKKQLWDQLRAQLHA